MATKQCQKFVRNAWKKDLCSNCFKSKEEHPAAKTIEIARVHPRLPDPPKQGILKTNKSTLSSKSNKVIFPSEECQVIGYGGDDVYSDDDDEPDFGDDPPKREEADTEEDKALQRLTKANTEFNSVPANLQEPKPGEKKTVVEPLRLGRATTDDSGKKKTLVVSVTPFGGASVNTSPRVRVTSKVAEALEKSDEKVAALDVVTAKCENGEAKVLEPPPANVSEPTPVVVEAPVPLPKIVPEIGIKRSHPIDKNSKFRLHKEVNEEVKNKEQDALDKKDEETRVSIENKLNDKLTTSGKVANLLDKAKKKVHHLPVIGDTQNFKFKGIDFTSNNKKVEANKVVVLDMYDLRDESKVNNIVEKTEEASIEVKIAPTIIAETKKSETQLLVKDDALEPKKPVANISSLYRVLPIVSEAAIPAVPMFEDSPGKRDVDEVSKEISVETEETPKMDVGSKVAEIAQPVNIPDKLENYEGIIGGEEVTLFSKQEERCAPDGRADSELSQEADDVAKKEEEEPTVSEEAPALPASPPPIMDARTSFLHSLTSGTRRFMGEKPKVPTKPVIIQNKKIIHVPMARPKSPSMETFLDASPKPHQQLAETLSDSGKKRQAPKPPSPSNERTLTPQQSLDDTDVVTPLKSSRLDMPLRVARSSENILELARGSGLEGSSDFVDAPEPSPRRCMSLSQDSLIDSGVGEIQAKKKSHRGRFSLRKFLHFGKHSKDLMVKEGATETRPTPPPLSSKPKPEIIHPQDLTGTRVEVVPPHRVVKTRRTSSSASSSSGEHRESDVLSDSSASQSVSSSGTSANELITTLELSRKPPPPPRNLSLENTPKPVRPPPPKNVHDQKRSPDETVAVPQRPRDNVYVNLGEARIGLAPNKPVRTGSLREADGSKKLSAATEKQLWTGSLRHGFSDGCKKIVPNVPTPPEDSGYESYDVSLTTTDSQTSSMAEEDNVYECVQPPVELRSSRGPSRGPRRADNPTPDVVGPEYSVPCSPYGTVRGHRRSDGNVTDNGAEYVPCSPYGTVRGHRRSDGADNGSEYLPCSPYGTVRGHRRSEGNVAESGQEYIKFRFLRSVSVPYCGSEAGSDIYSPYSFCGSEMGEEEYEWSPTSGRFQKVSRLKTKKGRSVVHKSLEDNYGAVVIANHEALTQVVEQMHLGLVTPATLRGLNAAASLRWSDFTLVRDVSGVTVERRVFYPALWGSHPVTVCVGPEQGLGPGIYGKSPFCLTPLTELHDLVPASCLAGDDDKPDELVQSSISVFCRLQIETLENYCHSAGSGNVTDEVKKEINFVLLQVINVLKTLQAQGIEDVPRRLRNMVVTREERDPHPRVCLLPSPGPDKDCISLCNCILDLLTDLPPTELSSLLLATLREEKAVSLSQAKALLEFTLWGPADIVWDVSAREAALQRWLDLERATVLQGLVRARVDLTVFEVWHLLFLVRTNAKMMAEASILLETHASAC